MTEIKRRGRPAKNKVPDSAIIVETNIQTTSNTTSESPPVGIATRYYTMYTEHIAAGAPGNNEAVHLIKPNERGLVSEVDLINAGVDLKWLLDSEQIEYYGML